MNKISRLIACGSDHTGITYRNYNFSFVLPKLLEHNDNLISLIEDEIQVQSWQKLQKFKKSGKATVGIHMILLSPEMLECVGQSSVDAVLKKYPTEDDINIAYEKALQEKKMRRENNLDYCGLLKTNSSTVCDIVRKI